MRKLLEIICGKVNKFRGFLIEVAVAVFCHVNVTGLSQGAKGNAVKAEVVSSITENKADETLCLTRPASVRLCLA